MVDGIVCVVELSLVEPDFVAVATEVVYDNINCNPCNSAGKLYVEKAHIWSIPYYCTTIVLGKMKFERIE